MADHQNESISPTVNKILDEFINDLQLKNEIDKEAITCLDQLLRTGKIPKPDEMDNALFTQHVGGKS